MRGLILVAAALVAGVVSAGAGVAAAQAGTLTRQGSTVVYTESDADLSANDVDIVQSASAYYIGDRNEAIIDAGSGCSPVVEWLWYCGSTGSANPAPTAFDIRLGGGNDRLLPNQYGAVFNCCSAPDIPVTVDGGPGNDTLTGALANDVLAGGFGSDVIAGGAGANDRVSYAGRTDGVTVVLGLPGAGDGSANDGSAGARDTLSDSDIEAVIGSEGSDTLGADLGGVPFTLDGRGGADVITGDDGPGNLLGGDGTDTINGGPGDETLEGGTGDDLLNGGFGSDSLDGQGGSGDLASYAGRSEAVTVDLGNPGADDGSANDGAPGSRDTITGVEGAIGGNGGDDIDGSTLALPLTLEGRGGADRIRGGLGANTIRGEGGNDELEGRGAPDLLEGGDGHDTMDGLGGSDTVRGGGGFDSIEARDGAADNVDCGADDDAATTDAVDTRANCDTPAPAAEGGGGGGTNTVTVIVPSRLLLDLAYGFTATRRATRLSQLSLDVERGAAVSARCRMNGKRCRGTRDFARAAASRAVRLRGFEGKALPVGSKLTLRATRSGMVGVVKTLTIRRRKAPSVRTLCLPPGASRPAAC